MLDFRITFQNKLTVKVQTQIFDGRTLVCTDLAHPGETRTILASLAEMTESTVFDIFFKNGSTGWEIARKLGTQATSFTLDKQKGRYVVT